MIDQWFHKDLEKIYALHDIVVVTDESCQANFLMDTIKDKYKKYVVENDIEELRTKLEVEKSRDAKDKVLIYTSIPREELSFIREYTETNGCVEIKHLHNYVKNKVHAHTGLNLKLDNNELIAAAKISVGKGKDYWIDLGNKGAGELFNLEKELIPFLSDPEKYINNLDPVIQEQFIKMVNELLGQPLVEKPCSTLAQEVMDAIFIGLLNNRQQPILKKVYSSWLDSVKYQKTLIQYIKSYSIPEDVQLTNVAIDHPFEMIDQQWVDNIGKGLNDPEKIHEWLPFIRKRSKSAAANLLQLDYWKHIDVLLSFIYSDITKISSMEECIEYYTTSFWKIDQAIRVLYTRFLDNKDLLEPFQTYYKDLLNVFLEKWFVYFDSYTTNQIGILEKIIKDNTEKTAIIVGDGVSYEISRNVLQKVDKSYKSHDAYILADIPSITEHNMSQLYIASGEVKTVHSDREKALKASISDKDVGFVQLESVGDTSDEHYYLICSYKDIDDMGEKLQQGALKFIDDIEDVFAEKIEQLFKNGYQKVFLVSDHGFVLTGILSEADKVNVDFKSDISKSERFVQTVVKQQIDNKYMVEIEKSYHGFNYFYFSKSINPFKTPGRYGYSHGGILPQELIVPFISWEQSAIAKQRLKINIINKQDLEEVEGDIFELKLASEEAKDIDIFNAERKIIIHFYSEEKLVNTSDIISISFGKSVSKEYQFEKQQKIEVRVLDSVTKELIDKCIVQKRGGRNLGGLL